MKILGLNIAFLMLCILATLAQPALAGQDWLALKAIRVAEPGAGQVTLSVAHSVQQTWALGDHFVYLRDTNGDTRLQRQVDLQLDFAWQLNPGWGFKVGIPYELVEFSPYYDAGIVVNYRLDDRTVRRTDSLGDLSFELRRAWGPEPELEGFAGLVWCKAVAPSGIGPFEAPHPLAATGEGRWQVQPGVGLNWKSGAWSWLLQVNGGVLFARETSLSSEAALGFGINGPQLPVGGNVWLGPRFDAQGGLGAAWDWYVEKDSRHSLGLELRAWHRSPLDQGGVLTPDTEASSVTLIPQLQSHFGRFHVLAAWSAPILYGNNVAASYVGGSHLRVDYGF